jgi:hypothetical protein
LQYAPLAEISSINSQAQALGITPEAYWQNVQLQQQQASQPTLAQQVAATYGLSTPSQAAAQAGAPKTDTTNIADAYSNFSNENATQVYEQLANAAQTAYNYSKNNPFALNPALAYFASPYFSQKGGSRSSQPTYYNQSSPVSNSLSYTQSQPQQQTQTGLSNQPFLPSLASDISGLAKYLYQTGGYTLGGLGTAASTLATPIINYAKPLFTPNLQNDIGYLFTGTTPSSRKFQHGYGLNQPIGFGATPSETYGQYLEATNPNLIYGTNLPNLKETEETLGPLQRPLRYGTAFRSPQISPLDLIAATIPTLGLSDEATLAGYGTKALLTAGRTLPTMEILNLLFNNVIGGQGFSPKAVGKTTSGALIDSALVGLAMAGAEPLLASVLAKLGFTASPEIIAAAEKLGVTPEDLVLHNPEAFGINPYTLSIQLSALRVATGITAFDILANAVLSPATKVAPYLIDNTPGALANAMQWASFTGSFPIGASLVNGQMPNTSQIEQNALGGGLLGLGMGYLTPLAPNFFSSRLGQSLSSGLGMSGYTNLNSLLTQGTLAPFGSTVAAFGLGAAIPTVTDVASSLSPFETSYDYKNGKSAGMTISLKPPDILQKFANVFINRPIDTNTYLDVAHMLTRAGVKPEDLSQAITDLYSYTRANAEQLPQFPQYNLPLNFNQRLPLVHFYSGDLPVAYMPKGKLPPLFDALARMATGNGDYIGGSGVLVIHMPDGWFRTPGDIELYTNNKQKLQSLADKALATATDFYNSHGMSASGLKLEEIGSSGQYSGEHIALNDYNQLDADGKPKRIADIIYRTLQGTSKNFVPDKIVTIDGINARSPEQVIEDKYQTIRYANKYGEDAGVNVAKYEKALKDLGLIEEARNAPPKRILDIGFGLPYAPNAYVSPEAADYEKDVSQATKSQTYRTVGDVLTRIHSLMQDQMNEATGRELALRANLAWALKNAVMSPINEVEPHFKQGSLEGLSYQLLHTSPLARDVISAYGAVSQTIPFPEARFSADDDSALKSQKAAARLAANFKTILNDVYALNAQGYTEDQIYQQEMQRILNAKGGLLSPLEGSKEVYKLEGDPKGKLTVVNAETGDKITDYHYPGEPGSQGSSFSTENRLGLKETNRPLTTTSGEGGRFIEPSEQIIRKLAESSTPRIRSVSSILELMGSPNIARYPQYLNYLRGLPEGAEFDAAALYRAKAEFDGLAGAKYLSDRFYNGVLDERIMKLADIELAKGLITQEQYDYLLNLAPEDLLAKTSPETQANPLANLNAIAEPIQPPEAQVLPTAIYPQLANTNAAYTQQTSTPVQQAPQQSATPQQSPAPSPSTFTTSSPYDLLSPAQQQAIASQLQANPAYASQILQGLQNSQLKQQYSNYLNAQYQNQLISRFGPSQYGHSGFVYPTSPSQLLSPNKNLMQSGINPRLAQLYSQYESSNQGLNSAYLQALLAGRISPSMLTSLNPSDIYRNLLNNGFFNNNQNLGQGASLQQVLQSLNSGYDFSSPYAIQPYIQMLEQMASAGQLSPSAYNMLSEYMGAYPLSAYGAYGSSSSPSASMYSSPYADYYQNYGASPYSSPYSSPYNSPYASLYASPYASPYSSPYSSPYTSPYASPYSSPYTSPYSSPYTSPYYYSNKYGEVIAPLPLGMPWWFAPYARPAQPISPLDLTYQMDLLSELTGAQANKQAAESYNPIYRGIIQRPYAGYLTRRQLQQAAPAQAFKQKG